MNGPSGLRDGVACSGLTRSEVFSVMGSSDSGLTSEDAARRLAEYGLNEIREIRGTPLILKFLENFYHLFAIMLWIVLHACDELLILTRTEHEAELRRVFAGKSYGRAVSSRTLDERDRSHSGSCFEHGICWQLQSRVGAKPELLDRERPCERLRRLILR